MSYFIKQIHDLMKRAMQEVLIGDIQEVEGEGTTIYPSNCNGKGRKPDILLDDTGRPSCVFKDTQCPYLVAADFKIIDYTKDIKCTVNE